MSEPTRRRPRLENLVLRWQARLDSAWSDRVLPWLIAAGLFIVLVALALARARSLEGGTELATFVQGTWLIGEGRRPELTVIDGHLMTAQAAFVVYPLAGLTRFLPTIVTLIVVQSAALAVGVVPLWRLCRRVCDLRVGATATLAGVYALYPAVHGLNLADFHPGSFAVVGLLMAAWLGLTGRWRLFALAVALVLSSRADLGLAVAGIGLILVTSGRRRAGLITASVGVAWTAAMVFIVQPAFGDGGFVHADVFGTYGDDAGEIVWHALTRPHEVLADLLAEENFDVMVVLLAPVLFLPVVAPRYLLPALPLQALYLVSEVPIEGQEGAEYTIAMTAFVMIATAFALARIGTRGIERVIVDPRVLGAILLASAVFFTRDSASSPYREPWEWGGRDATDAARLAAVDLVTDDAPVRASGSLLPLLAERRFVYELDDAGIPFASVAARGVSTVIVDSTETTWTSRELAHLDAGLRSLGFEVLQDRRGISLYHLD